MYNTKEHQQMEKQLETLTKQLVQINSVNGTKGEVDIANHIKRILLSFPYFQENPHLVWEQPLANDALGRKNIFALVTPRTGLKKTVIYHGHTDTVGVRDFQVDEADAFHPDRLLAFFQQYDEMPEVQKDALSGEYMFGRGALDMKSGLAIHILNLFYFSEHPEEIDGNVLATFNPVEENQHSGIMEAVKEFRRLKEIYGWEYVAAINNDFVSPLYPGDKKRYVYTGAVGKLLPCFFIRGRVAHVGETLTSIDPTLISSEINRRVNNNMAFAENVEGENMLPPTCLLQRDQKEFYNVQTVGTSHLYFNYFIYERSPTQVLEMLKQVAVEACREVSIYMERQYDEYLKRTQWPTHSLGWDIDVKTLAEYVIELENKGVDTEQISLAIVDQNPHDEPRSLCFKIVDALERHDPHQRPRVIIFFAPPFCPHNFLKTGSSKHRILLNKIHSVLETYIEKEEQFEVKKFFPFLSDSSYLSIHESDTEIKALTDNFPSFEQIYPIPIDDIRRLDIPAINVGVYGKDAHQWTERLYKPYSFGILPVLIRDLTKELLNT